MAQWSRGTSAAKLIGRQAEAARLDALLDRLSEGAARSSSGERRLSGSRRCSLSPVTARPRSKRQPLQAVFGTIESAEPDPFRVAMAAFRLVVEAAESSPLVLLVDDAHWLDRSSLGVLTFIARRLEGVPVALVATVRTGYAAPFD